MIPNTSAQDGSVSTATARGMQTKITMREVNCARKISEARVLASKLAEQIETYWDVADVIGSLTTRELLYGKHTFDDTPLERTRARVVDYLIAKWTGRTLKKLAEDATDEAIETLIDCAAAKGIDIDKKQARVSIERCEYCKNRHQP